MTNNLPKMVDISEKNFSYRTASAYAFIQLSKKTLEAIKKKNLPKGDIFSAAKIAGILAAKNTPNIIPLCHPLNLTFCDLDFKISKSGIEVFAIAKTNYSTGVEMEVLTAVSIASLTIYDMLKAIDKNIKIKNICLLEKTGGKSNKK